MMISVNEPTPVVRRKRMCPCGRAERSVLQRIHRAWYMRTFLFWLGFKRYKCSECSQKKWLFD